MSVLSVQVECALCMRIVYVHCVCALCICVVYVIAISRELGSRQ